MYGINSEPPKNCLDCPLCQGEYGPGNEKSYCAIKPKVKLKYRGSRPKECPIIADPLPRWQTEFIMALCENAKKQGDWIKKSDVICLLEKWADGYSYIEIPTTDAIKAIKDMEGSAE